MRESPAAVVVDENGNPVEITLESGVFRLEVISKIRSANGNLITNTQLFSKNRLDQTAILVDGTAGSNLASIDSSGRLAVSSNIVNPPATTPVTLVYQNTISVTQDNTYLIPNGQNLVIQRFAAGSEGSGATKSSKAEIFYDPNGTGTGMTLLRAIYLSDNNEEFSLDRTFTGNGTMPSNPIGYYEVSYLFLGKPIIKNRDFDRNMSVAPSILFMIGMLDSLLTNPTTTVIG